MEGEKICNERHKFVDEKFKRHDDWLAEHELKIDTLVKSDATNTQAIKELCNNISNLVNTIRWLIGILVVPFIGGVVGFFFYAIQKGLFK